MAIQGLQGTGDVASPGVIGTPGAWPGSERPTNWRQGILMRFPNGHAPLVALTAAMKKKVTDDPQFQWWEREVSNVRLTYSTTLGVGDPVTITLTADPYGFNGGNQVKVGDLLLVEETGEILRVATWTSNTSIACDRSMGSVAATTVIPGGNNVNDNLLIMGSMYAEGADTPESIRYRPVKKYNYTQIFRDSLKATRTAMHTRLRTVDEVRDAKQQALLYHSIRMEYAFLHGEKLEQVGGNGEPERTTSGIIGTILAEAPLNIEDENGTALKMERFEALMLEAFRFGSQEKMCFCGNRAMLAFQQMARRNASLEITPMQKEFGMDVRRLFTSSGTLVLKTHPLLNQVQSDMSGGVDGYFAQDSWALIVDMGNVTYRPLRSSDTQYLPDRQANGIDGLTSEYLTEAGLEVNHGKTHFLIKGLTAGAAD